MTLVASVLFLSALAASVFAIWATIGDAMPRIASVLEDEFGPAVFSDRRIRFGEVKHLRAGRSAEIIFLRPVLLKQEFKLAA